MKKWILVILLLLFPLETYAYSNQLIVNGNPIGIEIHANGIYIVDFYKVNQKDVKKEWKLEKGDKIVEVEGERIHSISEWNKRVKEERPYKIKIERNHELFEKEIIPEKVGSSIKTGLVLKDEIHGIGTISYIDPETGIYASLGHEIVESSNQETFDIDHGYIYNLNVEGINKSEDGKIGEVRGYFQKEILGIVEKNERNGIYGKYTEKVEEKDKIEVAKKEEIKKGAASIRYQLNNTWNDYQIEIISIEEGDPVKNIYFEIKDENLLKETGGIVQGMSGSPILQNNKIIGVVNYVIVKDAKKGYGIFIEKMLEEGDKLLQE